MEKNNIDSLQEKTLDMQSRIIRKVIECECIYCVPEDLAYEIIKLVDDMRNTLLYEIV